MPLLPIFIAILLLAFSIVALLLRPTPDQNAAERRIAEILQVHMERRNEDGTIQRLKPAQPKTLTWLGRSGWRKDCLRRMQLLLLQSQSSRSAASVLMATISLGVVTLLFTYLLSRMFVLSLAVGVVAACIPIAALCLIRDRRIAAFNAALPDCIEMCARALRAGHSIVAAMDIVAQEAVEPAKTEFGEVFKKQNYGLALRDALMQMLERVPSADLQVFITGVLVQKDTGGNLAEILDRIVAVIRDRLRIQGEIRVHTAQGRLTGWILCLLPLILLLMLNVINPGYSAVLFRDPAGKRLLYIGLGLLILGGFMIRQIVSGIEV